MTEDERKNRNPAPRVLRTTPAAIEAMPIVTAADLELHRVYVVHTAKYFATLNYMGRTAAHDPVTLDAIALHFFHGPRNDMRVFIAANEDGSFRDAEGTRLTVRRWTGADQ